MTLRVVGAGLGRTGTHSLTSALEQLLGAPCYHMIEVLEQPAFVPYWQDAVDGVPVDWDAVMNGYAATVDWPAAAFWQELMARSPDAIVLLSTRSSAQAWWKSADETIFALGRRGAPPDPRGQDLMRMILGLFEKRFSADWSDPAAAQRAYERHNDAVRAGVPPARLVEWQPGDGWEPICAALSLPVPGVPFPHVNKTDEFRAMAGLE